MFSNAAGVLIFLAVFGIMACNPVEGIDCRKFIYAPQCRGVAAKRDNTNPGHYDPAAFINEDNDKNVLGSLRAAIEMLQQDAEYSQTRTTANRRNEIENRGRMYQQEQTNRFLKFLFGNRRGNNERDYLPVQGFENL